jgi:ADP-heptose:LPS heptosyltransferase
MDVLVDYQGNWGLGDLLCSDPMVLGLVERHGEGTKVWLRGKVGNVIHNPLVAGMARADQRFDRTVEVKLFTHMAPADYARLEAMPSLIDHMCSYADVQPSDRRPRLHLHGDDRAVLRQIVLPPRRPRIAMCADFVDPLRHWPLDRWRTVAALLQELGAEVVGIGQTDRLGVGTDLVGRLSIRETAAVLGACDLFVGNNSGPFHYAQAAGVPCVTLFSLASPQRFVHPGAVVHPVRAEGLPCLECMTRCFASMLKTGCVANPRGRCMLDIPVEAVLDAIDRALQESSPVSASRSSR